MNEDLNRRRGVEMNNASWRLLSEGFPGPDATRDEQERFPYRAHASAYHWMETPSATPANRARGEHSIARAAVAVGLPEQGLLHALRCLELCRSHPGDVEDWDHAFAEEGIARALAASGDLDGAAAHHATAATLGAAIVDVEDREVFLEELGRGPWCWLDSA